MSTSPAELPPANDRWIGRVVAEKFRVDALLGEGAMGRVYRGEQLALGKPIAIKVLHKHLGGDPRLAKRFHREALAASRLTHPNALQIIDFGEADDGTLYIAMELLEGEPLQTIIDHEAPFTPLRIGDIMVQILGTLEEAHHAGIVHRDLKPENIVVLEVRGGRELVKVCDFGIAKITEDEGRSTAITKDGYVCGTPEYMAPEQARGEPVDARTDIYSAGVVLYQLLCGQVPFRAESALGIITKHITEPPVPPRDVRRAWAIPPSLERIALRALSKRAQDRFGSAAEMADAIADAIHDLGARASERLGDGSFTPEAELQREQAPNTDEAIAKVVAPRASRGWTLGLAGALVVLGVGVWLWLAPPLSPPATVAEAAPAAPPAEPSPPSPPAPAPIEATRAAEPPEPDPAEAAPLEATAPVRRPRVRSTPSPPAAEPELAPAPPSAFEEGRRLMLRGDLPAAIARFEEAARSNPGSATPHRELGRAYMRSGNVARGIAAYRRYLELAPDASDRAIVERIIAQHGG